MSRRKTKKRAGENKRVIKWTAQLVDAVVANRPGSIIEEYMDELLRWLGKRQTPDALAIATEFSKRGIESSEARQLALALLERVLFDGHGKPYHVLGFRDGTASEEVRLRYYRLIQVYHPDRNEGDQEWLTNRTEQLNRAYARLRKPENDVQEISPPSWPTRAGAKGAGYSKGYKSGIAGKYPDKGSPLRAFFGDAAGFQTRFFAGLIIFVVVFLLYLYYENSPSRPVSREDVVVKGKKETRGNGSKMIAGSVSEVPKIWPEAEYDRSTVKGSRPEPTSGLRTGSEEWWELRKRTPIIAKQEGSIAKGKSNNPMSPVGSGVMASQDGRAQIASVSQEKRVGIVGRGDNSEKVSAEAIRNDSQLDERQKSNQGILAKSSKEVVKIPPQLTSRSEEKQRNVVEKHRVFATDESGQDLVEEQAVEEGAVIARRRDKGDAKLESDLLDSFELERSLRIVGSPGKRSELPEPKVVTRKTGKSAVKPIKKRQSLARKEDKKATRGRSGRSVNRQVTTKGSSEEIIASARELLDRYRAAYNQGNSKLLASTLSKTIALNGIWQSRDGFVRKFAKKVDGTISRSYRFDIDSIKLVRVKEVAVEGRVKLYFLYSNGDTLTSGGKVKVGMAGDANAVRINRLDGPAGKVRRGNIIEPVQDLLYRYSDYYREGDLPSFISLFMDNSDDNKAHGRGEVEESYEKLFSETRSRELQFNIGEVTPLDRTRVRVEATYSVSIEYKDGRELNAEAPITVWLEGGSQGYRIVKLEY